MMRKNTVFFILILPILITLTIFQIHSIYFHRLAAPLLETPFTRGKLGALSTGTYNIQAVSSNGQYALLSTLHQLLLFDLREMKVAKSLSENSNVTTFGGSFCPQNSKIIYSVEDHSGKGQKIFLFDTVSGKTSELDANVFKGGDIYSLRFLNDTSIIFQKRKQRCCKIILYNLQTRTVEKEFSPRSVMSQLFINGKYVIYME